MKTSQEFVNLSIALDTFFFEMSGSPESRTRKIIDSLGFTPQQRKSLAGELMLLVESHHKNSELLKIWKKNCLLLGIDEDGIRYFFIELADFLSE